MPPSYEDDTPRLVEIARILTDFRNEFRATVQELVRRDVYTAEQQALRDRVANLEADGKQLEADRKQIRNLAYGAVFTALVSIAILIIGAVFNVRA